MTARPEYMQSAAELPGVDLLALEGLQAGDSIELARLAMARDPNAADMAERIAVRSNGNPLFIEELTWAVPFVGTGLGGQRAQIPNTLQSTLRARLDSVGFRAREVAEWVAVIGGGFDRSLLTAASGLDQATISADAKAFAIATVATRFDENDRSVPSSDTRCSRRRPRRGCFVASHALVTSQWRTRS